VLKPCSAKDVDSILEVINQAAVAYRSVIPVESWHEPYMSRRRLDAELDAGVSFSGIWEDEKLVGVMGIQHVSDVTLIRHAYVLPSHQRRGVGATLLAAMRAKAGDRPLLVGTWADAHWAISFYQRNGFRLHDQAEAARLLSTHWDIPDRQAEVSVVLEAER
jgi:GNAT superfamily N-acetyltransferase